MPIDIVIMKKSHEHHMQVHAKSICSCRQKILGEHFKMSLLFVIFHNLCQKLFVNLFVMLILEL